MATKLSWSLNALPNEIRAAADLCRARGLGLEVTAFAFPSLLDEGFDEQVHRHAECLEGLAPISLHGPYFDLYPASPDPDVVKLCRKRHERALLAAERLRASVYVAHLNYVPLIRNPGYRAKFVERTAAFWASLAVRAAGAGITIALENLWEPEPGLQLDVVRAAGCENVRASFDNGHAMLYSGLSSSRWLEALRPVLAHCHLHDNDRQTDQHLPIGEGLEEWDELFTSLLGAGAVVVLESDGLRENLRSLEATERFAG